MNRQVILNASLFALLALFATTLQTTLWFQLFGSTPAPQLWLIIALYLILYRKTLPSFLWVYGLGLLISPFSGAALRTLMPTLFLITLAVSYIKARFFWPSLRYFVFASFATTMAFQILIVCLSYLLDSNPTSFSFFTRAAEVLLTTIFASLFYSLCSRIDKITHSEVPVDVQGVNT